MGKGITNTKNRKETGNEGKTASLLYGLDPFRLSLLCFYLLLLYIKHTSTKPCFPSPYFWQESSFVFKRWYEPSLIFRLPFFFQHTRYGVGHLSFFLPFILGLGRFIHSTNTYVIFISVKSTHNSKRNKMMKDTDLYTAEAPSFLLPFPSPSATDCSVLYVIPGCIVQGLMGFALRLSFTFSPVLLLLLAVCFLRRQFRRSGGDISPPQTPATPKLHPTSRPPLPVSLPFLLTNIEYTATLL
jgi:hypothetical protein